MPVYLLDTNIISNQWDELSDKHQDVKDFIDDCDEKDWFCITCISVAEIQYGYNVVIKTDIERKKRLYEGLNSYKTIFYVDKNAIKPYACIRAALFNKYGKRNLRGLINEKQPEQLIEITSAKKLGIQENDLWIVAIAIAYDMTFVTAERKMNRLLEIAKIAYPSFGWVII